MLDGVEESNNAKSLGLPLDDLAQLFANIYQGLKRRTREIVQHLPLLRFHNTLYGHDNHFW